jgi:hypothetical protein
MDRLGKAGLVLASLVALGLGTSRAAADEFRSGFEPPAYTGSPSGTSLTGQQGWYLPPVAGTTNQNVYTYAGNTLGLPANPTGQLQFIGARAPGDGTFPRAQHNLDFSSATTWSASYDFAAHFSGTLPAVDNLSSFSLQSPSGATVRSFIALNTWANPATATTWNAQYNVFDASGAATNNLSPGAAWNNLLVDHWYREETTFDFTLNRILEVSITDLTTGITSTAAPSNWYLTGGATPTDPLPSAFRFFVGGGVGADAGNVMGWDNVLIQAVPEPTGLTLLGLGTLGLFGYHLRRRNLARG